MSEFAPILIYLGFSLLVSLILVGLPFLFSSIVRPIQKNCRLTNVVSIPSVMPEVVSIYDFIWFSILFIIFDLEVTFFFPWAISLNKIDLFGFWSMMAFY
ncbi:hypothetical protein LUZ61_022351 [Rhynchospora tenuis]|uniref:NADH-ubiquinone oxidoreductase chain 3 n=1 Tax=Rhynchospora tenuis TaxID=198213 RepID=A0AAD5YYK4_9POAL|nr:hypothetical protein LUZ61_022351 [Rhynchospora tenuis]